VNEERAEKIVAKLRDRHVFAHVERAGVYQFGIRVVIPDGREAIWDAEGDEADLEAVILQDGDLTGFVPTIPGSAELPVDEVVRIIANTNYDAPAEVPHATPTAAPAAAAQPTRTPVLPADHPTHRPLSGLLRRLSGR
jgi:hypothetical protein